MTTQTNIALVLFQDENVIALRQSAFGETETFSFPVKTGEVASNTLARKLAKEVYGVSVTNIREMLTITECDISVTYFCANIGKSQEINRYKIVRQYGKVFQAYQFELGAKASGAYKDSIWLNPNDLEVFQSIN